MFEESGLVGIHLNLWGIHEDPAGNQNVTFRFWGVNGHALNIPELTNEFSEPDEIADQAWINIKHLGNFDWAFNHDNLILDAYVAMKTKENNNDIFY